MGFPLESNTLKISIIISNSSKKILNVCWYKHNILKEADLLSAHVHIMPESFDQTAIAARFCLRFLNMSLNSSLVNVGKSSPSISEAEKVRTYVIVI